MVIRFKGWTIVNRNI